MAQRTPKHHIEPPTDKELEIIRKVIRNSDVYRRNPAGDFLRHRDETLIFFAAASGLRPLELVSLKWKDIDFQRNRIFVNPYNNKQREFQPAILTEKAKEVILEYKKYFEEVIISSYVFPSLVTMLPITPNAFGRKYRRAFEEAGLKKVLWFTLCGQPITNCQPYGLRKYYGSKIYLSTGDPHAVKRALRHTKLSSQEPYIFYDDELIARKINSCIK